MAFNFAENENKILNFWKDNKIFEKLRKKNEGKNRWSFLDGPITANNPMGAHHAWGRTYKDIFQRYKAMQGYDERYQNGFDCQGLWVEVEVEKELGFKNKKDIEAYGIDKFVEKCKERVKKYSAIQTQQSIRLGQWADWENSYYTMSDKNNYAIWHFLKKCWEEGYLYKGHDVVPWCSRCGTAISEHEILTEEYKEITHKAIYVKFPSVKEKNTYFLAWTTTPWTLPGNVALAVNPDFEYVKVADKENGEVYILLEEKVDEIFGKKNYILIEKVKGKKLDGLEYKPIFSDLPINSGDVKTIGDKERNTIVLWKDITKIEGTGIVHIAPACGAEDFKLSKEHYFSPITITNDDSNYREGFGNLSGKFVGSLEVRDFIIDNLKNKNFIFRVEDYKHRYPTCWRCKSELIFRLVDEWYISMEKLRKPLEEITKKITWIPSFGRDRELDWLKNMHDWLISKKRYWGLALPIFECECGHFEVIGSKEELKKRAVEGWDKFEGNSPHRPWVDNIKIKCEKCKKLVSRIKDVGNPWLDAGIVSFSTIKYFEDKNYWKKWFPAELVCESFPGQFKNWFYSLLVMSAVLENTEPMKTIFGYASVKDEKGEEMHKSKGNAIWFDEAVEKIGADPMRWMYSRQNPAENLNFGYNLADEIKRKLLTLYNAYVFFNTYVKKEELSEKLLEKKSGNILDKWIVSKIDHLISASEFNLDKYDIARVVLAIEDFFINDLSLWYIRRSRKRFHEYSQDRKEAVATLYYALLNLVKLVAPIMPFFAEEMYQQLKLKTMPESVHLCDWPETEESQTDMELENKMDEARELVNLALAKRAEKQIKVKQPLASLKIKNKNFKIKNETKLLDLIKEEVNVKEIIFGSKIKEEIELDTKITEALKEEHLAREIIRMAKIERKELGLTHHVLVDISGTNAILSVKFQEEVKKEIGTKHFIVSESTKEADIKKEIIIDGKKYWVFIKK